MSHLREYIERNDSSESNRSSAMELLRRKITCTELLLKEQQPEKSALPDRGRKELVIPPFDASSSRRSSSRSSRDSSLRSVEEKQQKPDSLEERQQLYLALQKRRKNSTVGKQRRLKSCVESQPTKAPLLPQKSKSLDPNLFGDDSASDLFRELRDKGVSENEAAARQRRFTSLKKVVGYFEDDL
mmetsp:Transcript_13640/g.20765  ORF Transcript_13640/g.20765 Transcript_13640/m.20765 type:complete len:185 (-) Transcript_13640:111-665(-)